DRPVVLNDESMPDRDALDRLVIEKRNPGEAHDAKDRKDRKILSTEPQIKAQGREDRDKHKERKENTPLREDGRLHTRVECRFRNDPSDTKERGRCKREGIAESDA